MAALSGCCEASATRHSEARDTDLELRSGNDLPLPPDHRPPAQRRLRVAFAYSLAGPGPPVRGCHPSAEMSVRLWGIALAPNKAYKLTVPEDVELQINQACLGPESTVRCFFPSFFLPTAVPIVLCRGVGAAPHCSGCCALLQRRCR
jgi:hypothetical protein